MTVCTVCLATFLLLPWSWRAPFGHRSRATLSYTFLSHAALLQAYISSAHNLFTNTWSTYLHLFHTHTRTHISSWWLHIFHTPLFHRLLLKMQNFFLHHTHPFHMQHFLTRLSYTHLRQLLHTTLSYTTLSHVTLSHTTLYNNRSSTISFVFPAFLVLLQTQFLIIKLFIGRSWLVRFSSLYFFCGFHLPTRCTASCH